MHAGDAQSYQASVAKLLWKSDASSKEPDAPTNTASLSLELQLQQFEEQMRRNEDLEPQTAVNIDVPFAWQGPARYAQHLMQKFPFNEEQINLIALLVFPLEKAWQNRHQKETYQLPHDLGLSRVLLVEGGGCGRTTIVLKVMKPLLLVYFGHNGVQLAARSGQINRKQDGAQPSWSQKGR